MRGPQKEKLVKLSMTLLCLLVSMSAQGQNVTCTTNVPQEVCKFATASFYFWELPGLLIHKVPVVIVDPATFEKELSSLQFTTDHMGLARNSVALTYSKSILLERDKGNPCPVRVVISTDEFRRFDEKSLKRVAEVDFHEVDRTADYIGGFLAGCESSLDY